LHTPQATAELEQPMAEIPHFVSATQRDEWDSSHLSSSVKIWTVQKPDSFSSIREWLQSHGVRGPHLPRRVAEAK